MSVSLLSFSALAAKPEKAPVIPSDEQLGFYGGTRDEILSQVKRVGLMPVQLPKGITDRPDADQAIQTAITAQLKAAGIDVVGPEKYQAAYDKFNQQLGGVYDSHTGELKKDQMRAVLTYSSKEFISNEHLDALVYVGVKSRSAEFRSTYAIWDGVRERVDGSAEKSAIVEFFSGTGGGGTLPAFSLIVQIVNPGGKVLYGRFGGIQLTNYYDNVRSKKTGLLSLEFLQVPVNDLLRDQQRIERAAAVACMPLHVSPVDIANGTSNPDINLAFADLHKYPAPPVGYNRKQKTSSMSVSRDEILRSTHRVAITPVWKNGFAIPDDARNKLLDLIRNQLKPLQWDLVDAGKVHDVLFSQLEKAAIFDPYTGKVDRARVKAARKEVIGSLGITPAPDAILWVELRKRYAEYEHGDVEWDGVNQSGFSLGPVVRKFFKGSAVQGSGKGTITAVSLSIEMTNAEDDMLFESLGGIELLQQLSFYPGRAYELNRTEARERASSELFKDGQRLENAVQVALHDLVEGEEAPEDTEKQRGKH